MQRKSPLSWNPNAHYHADDDVLGWRSVDSYVDTNFSEQHSLHLQPCRKMETVCFSETIVSTYGVTAQNIIVITTAVRTPNFPHYRLHKNPPLDPVLTKMNSVVF
jgi:hypothetical protein